MAVPTTFTQADSFKWTVSLQKYSAVDGWTMFYVIANVESSHQLPDATVDSSGRFVIEVPAATTLEWSPGGYTMFGYVKRGVERIQVSRRQICVNADPLDAAADHRTHNERTLDAIIAMIEGKATRDQQSVMVDGQTLMRYRIDELRVFRDDYTRRVARERAPKGAKASVTRVRMS